MIPKALIFDVDGTLAETEETHRKAFNQTFAEFGLDWHWSRDLYGELLKTTGGKERMAAYLRSRSETPDPEKIAEIHRRKTALYGDLIASGATSLRPGIADLIRDAAQRNIRLAVATTTNRPNVDRLCEACFGQPAHSIFDVIAAGDEVPNKKPAPDVFTLAVTRLGLKPSDCLGFEDSHNGLLSCTRAGVPCVVSPGIYTLGSNFDQAITVLDCFTEINTIDRLSNMLGN